MSSSRMLSALLAVLTLCCALALDEDFAFEVSDDLEVEFPPDTPKKLWGMTDLTATVGRVFHLAIPKDSFKDSVKNYEAKTDQDSPLPSWLLFDKTGGVFWGVPLEENVGALHISVKAVRPSNTLTDKFTLVVREDDDVPDGTDKCPATEDSTVLTLIIDKAIKAIKPKQRVIAINNIAKFFGMPYDAFTLKSQLQPDDITDSSVVLAGPGNLRTRSSKLTSLVQVTVGCEGRLWLNSAPMIHQLKQQARDGTITEVLRLPLIGWRVKTETRPLIREKRQDDSYVGSGDYEEYYEYDDYDDPDKDSEEPILSSPSTPTATTSGTTSTFEHSSTHVEYPTTPIMSETHPHRHHHGELRPLDEVDPSIPVMKEPDQQTTYSEPTSWPKTEETEIFFSPEYTSPQETSSTPWHTPATTASSSTSTTTTTTTITTTTSTTSTSTQSTPVTESEATKPDIVTSISGLYKPSETLDSDDEYDEEYDDGDDEESATEVPFVRNEVSYTNHHPNFPEIVTDTEMTLVEVATTKPRTESIEFIPETIPTVRTTTEDFKTVIISEETLTPTTTTTEIPPTTLVTTTPTADKITVIEEESTTFKHTTLRHTESSMTTPKVTTQQVTETIEYEVKNFPPTKQIRLNRIAITAGQHYSQIVPEDMFTDMEDGNKLKLEFLDIYGSPVNKSCWCQFNPQKREIYGLPLEEDVSRWEFMLRATDKEGASVSEMVEIHVQQHKHWRVVNHEFSLYARVEKKQDFLYPVDWALHILRGISMVFQTTNTSKITVRRVSYATDPIIFTWTNDSLDTKECPKSEIDQLFSMLTANDEGDPSIALSRSLAPELRAKKVTQHGLGVCEEVEVPVPRPLPPVVPPSKGPPVIPPSHLAPILPPSNLPPILRNAIDHLKATVGELFVYRVPDDTFYDPEDVDPRNLEVDLYTSDRKEIHPSHWLQFDTKNKEFYGIPSARDASRTGYQLICKDKGGLTASDTLIVEIVPAPIVNYNVEFSMTVETEYDHFVASPSMKRKFIEKLQELFQDDNTDNIHMSQLTKGSAITRASTVVTWYNKSLTRDDCPWDEIKKVEGLLVNSDRIISNRVHKVMGDEFAITAFRLQNLGVCKTTTPATTRVQDTIVPVDEGASQESHDDYLLTFIVPAVIISAMLLLAGIAACVLYRRRRSGKMNIEEDGRQSYGNKGIPVIFQEELDEKPEPGTKAPVILKDEKPPLAPPEYSKSGSLKLAADDSEPYQPPPPFTRTQDNGRQPRPKPTPTYRKPPPYVPP